MVKGKRIFVRSTEEIIIAVEQFAKEHGLKASQFNVALQPGPDEGVNRLFIFYDEPEGEIERGDG